MAMLASSKIMANLVRNCSERAISTWQTAGSQSADFQTCKLPSWQNRRNLANFQN